MATLLEDIIQVLKNFYFGKKKKVFNYVVNEIEALMIVSIFDLILADRLIDIDQTILMKLVKSK